MVKGDDRDQHDEPAKQGVQQELDRRVLAAGTAVGADQEVDRDQHRLEEDVEQEHVGRGKHPDHEGLQDQHQREVVLLSLPGLGLVMPCSEQTDRHQDDRHQDEDQRDAVHPDRVAHAERLDPGVQLRELELLG